MRFRVGWLEHEVSRMKRKRMDDKGIIGELGKAVKWAIMIPFIIIFIVVLWWLAEDLIIMLVFGFIGLIVMIFGLSASGIEGKYRILAMAMGFILVFMGILSFSIL